MASGMYPNMMMSGPLMSGTMMPSTGMEMMTGTGLDMMQQPQMELALNAQSISSGSGVDMNMMMMNPAMMGMYQNMNTEMAPVEERKEIVLKTCKLTPPVSQFPQPPASRRPHGCRTIYVGGLPSLIRESTIREIFERYGRIHTLRLSKKDYCHIRFEREESTDEAVLISGYHIKLISKSSKEGADDSENSHDISGWLHVDYAMVSVLDLN